MGSRQRPQVTACARNVRRKRAGIAAAYDLRCVTRAKAHLNEVLERVILALRRRRRHGPGPGLRGAAGSKALLNQGFYLRVILGRVLHCLVTYLTKHKHPPARQIDQ